MNNIYIYIYIYTLHRFYFFMVNMNCHFSKQLKWTQIILFIIFILQIPNSSSHFVYWALIIKKHAVWKPIKDNEIKLLIRFYLFFFFFDISIFQPFTRVSSFDTNKKRLLHRKEENPYFFCLTFLHHRAYGVIYRYAHVFPGVGGGVREHYIIYFKRKRKSTRQPYLLFFGRHDFLTFKNLNKTAHKHTHTHILSF